MAVIEDVGDCVNRARVILQDTHEPYRYSQEDLKDALALGVYEMRRLRADLFIDHTDTVVPDLSTTSPDITSLESIDIMYRMQLVHFIVAHVMKRDEEEASEARAGAFMGLFRQSLTQTG